MASDSDYEPTPEERAANTAAFETAKAECPSDHMVCGALRDGVPVYFHAPQDADQMQVGVLAFEAVHGRKMTDGEAMLASRLGTNV